MEQPLLILIAISLFAVLAVLATGIGGFGVGGRFNARHGNRMMRWRIIAQAIAIALVMLFALIFQG
ncbi:MAG: twin transmembrane helix small protein [Paracoccus sp. (in: a-proteobacteria)]|nr:twin transmembrane helix small protein [Paracoccus sp. (in: a-proteobacteria)]